MLNNQKSSQILAVEVEIIDSSYLSQPITQYSLQQYLAIKTNLCLTSDSCSHIIGHKEREKVLSFEVAGLDPHQPILADQSL